MIAEVDDNELIIDLRWIAASDDGKLAGLLAGEGGEQSALQQLAGELGIAERVSFVGRIAGQSMADFYRRLDVFVLPSRSTPNWQEQFGRVAEVLEQRGRHDEGGRIIGNQRRELRAVVAQGAALGTVMLY